MAIEFRSKEPGSRWRRGWDCAFWVASAGLASCWGWRSGTSSEASLDADGNITVSLIDLLSPFALLFGVTTVAMLALHGSLYLRMKLEGGLLERLEGWVSRLAIAFVCFMTALVVLMIVGKTADHGPLHGADLAGDLPGAALLALDRGMVDAAGAAETFGAFLASRAMIGLLLVSGAVGI